jgi:hypothetical protein
VVVLPLSSHSEKKHYESSKEGSAHKAAQELKDCIGTPLSFESQVETPEASAQVWNLIVGYWLAEGPDSLKVSGGSKKH